MEAVILAAGEGKRLRPLTTYYPKPMMPVGNRPILEWIINALRISGIRRITIVVGYQRDKIIRYFGDGLDFGVDIDYVFQDKQLGTAHALHMVGIRDDFILLPGDNMIEPECIEMVKSEKNSILAVVSSAPSKYGAIVMERGKVNIKEKMQFEGRALVFTGIGHFSGEIFEIVEKGINEEMYDLPELLNRVSNLKVVSGKCAWLDAVYPWDLLGLNWHALKRVPRRISGKIEKSIIIGNVEIGEGSRIGAGTYIKGPVIIGENCTIGPNSVIMPGVSIGDGAEIGALSYIENSIIMGNVYIGEGSTIKNSVIGNGAMLGTNSVILSGKVKRIIDNEIVEVDGGAIVGDGTVIGAGTVIRPGILVGSDSIIGDMIRVEKDIENSMRVM